MSPRGLVVAAPKSGSGKTTVSLGLMRAFSSEGRAVVGAKSGPDYIDPAFHEAATGRPSFNFDSWTMSAPFMCALAERCSRGADLFVVEGSMGLFDGAPAPRGQSGASSDIAAALNLPVLLVIDVSGQAQSAAAIVKGCISYDPHISIAGVVLNKVGSPRHLGLARDAIEALGVPVVGSLPKSQQIALPERHLGLVQAKEIQGLDQRLDELAAFVARYVDLPGVIALAAPLLVSGGNICGLKPPAQRIAVAKDAAFSFLYPHILTGWREQGAEIFFFSPLADEPPPNAADMCWLPGGYPELYVERLSAAQSFMMGLRTFATTRSVHGECGGYMILGDALTNSAGLTLPMAGLLALETSFAARKLHLGYRDATLLADGPLGLAGQRLRGHEFHYASIVKQGDDPPFAMMNDAYGSSPAPTGSRRGLVSGSFFHVIAESA